MMKMLHNHCIITPTLGSALAYHQHARKVHGFGNAICMIHSDLGLLEAGTLTKQTTSKSIS